MSATITGFPVDIASSATIPNASRRETLGRTNTSQAAYTSGRRSSEIRPKKRTRSATPIERASRFIASRDDPPPATKNDASGTYRAASTKCSTPLWGTIRPTRRTIGTSGGIRSLDRTAEPSTSGRKRRWSTAFGITLGLYLQIARLVAA